MASLEKIDDNFIIKTISETDIKFYNADNEIFTLHGIYRENDIYVRMPNETAKKVNDGVFLLNECTAGGRLRFTTDSDYIAISVKKPHFDIMPHITVTASHGFDIYDGKEHIGTFNPPIESIDQYDGIVKFDDRKEREITVNFPLYSGVYSLYIGLREDAVIKKHKPYSNEKPIIYYGSSITQGGCASRPGMAYQEIVSRALNLDYVNLGFSGSAKAEDVMIEYIKNLDMSVFVLDYDHNAPSAEHLKNTHEKMFAVVRKYHPTMPIILMSRPRAHLTDDEVERRKIIETTYNNAIAAGDKNVYFIDGEKLTALCGNDGTVDCTHPNDFGFAAMAQAVVEVLSKI